MANPWQDRYLALLDRVCRQPDRYVTAPQLRLIRLFMDGYEMGLTDADCSPGLDGWSAWVWLRFGICHPGWSTTRVIVHACGGQASAIAAYPRLVRQFLAERDTLGGPAGLWATVREQFPPGGVRVQPTLTHTTADD